MAKKLTKRQVETARPGEADRFIWDEALPGFGLRLRSSGRRSFIVQYRTREGRSRRRVLGTFPTMTVDEARREARDWLTTAQKGKDPAVTLDLARRAATVRELCQRFLKDHAEPHKKPRSAAEDKRLIDRIVGPALGSRKAAAVCEEDIAQLHKSLRATPYTANRVRALLSAVFNQAEGELRKVKADWINPCRRVKPYKEVKRRRYLAPAELAALGQALTAAEAEGSVEPASVAAIRLLILTGARRWEILSLPWSQVDLEGRRLRLADSKTGAKDIHLNPPAIEVLRGLAPVEGNPYVIPGRREGAHMQDLKSAWQKIRDKAGLEDLRLHDLRHSFASVGAGAGLSLPVIGALLGHTQAATTARYAHLASDPLQEAADLVGRRLAEALEGGGRKEGGEVVPLGRGGQT
jgi:integrase